MSSPPAPRTTRPSRGRTVRLPGRGWCLVVWAASVHAPPAIARQGQDSVLALANVTLVDGTGAPAREGMTVLVSDGTIAYVGPAADADLPADAEVHDLSGRYLIPGLIDAHPRTRR